MAQKSFDTPLTSLLMHIGKLLDDALRSSLLEGDIHFGQARILIALSKHKQLAQTEIGHGVHITPATVTNLVKKMEASGLIERNRDLNDDRIINVRLTPKGVEAALFSQSVIRQIEQKITADLTEEELVSVLDTLVNVRDVLGGSDPALLKNQVQT